jgi:hypothetical protein
MKNQSSKLKDQKLSNRRKSSMNKQLKILLRSKKLAVNSVYSLILFILTSFPGFSAIFDVMPGETKIIRILGKQTSGEITVKPWYSSQGTKVSYF